MRTGFNRPHRPTAYVCTLYKNQGFLGLRKMWGNRFRDCPTFRVISRRSLIVLPQVVRSVSEGICGARDHGDGEDEAYFGT